MQREKIVAILSAVICAIGLYGLGVAMVTPAPDVSVRDVELPRPEERTPGRLSYGVFKGSKAPSRNPFNFSEGWQRLEPPELSGPPVPPPSRMIPSIGDVGSANAPGTPYVYVETLPTEIKKDVGLLEEDDGEGDS